MLVGVNDLATTCPEIALEWDYDKNIGCTPEGVTKGSNRIVWWKCGKGHSWKAMVNKRVSRNSMCPYCRKGERI